MSQATSGQPGNAEELLPRLRQLALEHADEAALSECTAKALLVLFQAYATSGNLLSARSYYDEIAVLRSLHRKEASLLNAQAFAAEILMTAYIRLNDKSGVQQLNAIVSGDAELLQALVERSRQSVTATS